MCYLQPVVHSILLLTIPSAFYSNSDLFSVDTQTVETTRDSLKFPQSPSYDEILNLVDDLESGELEKRSSLADLERLNRLLVTLVKQGILPGETEEEIEVENAVRELFYGEENPEEYRFSVGSEEEYVVAPAFLHNKGHIILCKSWIHKQWDQSKKFVEKHKKAFIIGTAVVVAAVVVAGVAGVIASAGIAAAEAASSPSEHEKSGKKNEQSAINSFLDATTKSPAFPILDEGISSFKEDLVNEQFLPTAADFSQQEKLSWGENARTLGSLFAHKSLETFCFSREMQEMLRSNGGIALDSGHSEIDQKFATNYTPLFTSSSRGVNFTTLSYQTLGEQALTRGHFTQAVHDLGKAIELDPMRPFPYLTRGIAHFGLEQYDRSLDDYYQFVSQIDKTPPLSPSNFSLGFAKGLPQGIYDSSEGFFLFLSDLISHPVHTGGQIWDALSALSRLAQTEQWETLSAALVPEVHQLIKEWDALSSDKRGELAGYIFGKYGSDIIIPGALTKAVSAGLKGSLELRVVYQGLHAAEQTLLLESVAELKTGANIEEVIQTEKQISNWLGEGTKFIRNEAKDPVFLSKDGLRRVRFDFNDPSPHQVPHAHVEIKVNDNWIKSGPIYPTDMPHN